MPERPRHAARLRPLALAGIAVAVLATGCANYEVLHPYQPGAGVQTNAPGVQVRNLMVLTTDGGAKLSGTVITDAADELTGVTGTALKTDGTPGEPLTISTGKVALPAHKGVDLGSTTTSVKGATPGGMTTLTLNFAKTGPVTMTVPVVAGGPMDVSTVGPSAAASNAG